MSEERERENYIHHSAEVASFVSLKKQNFFYKKISSPRAANFYRPPIQLVNMAQQSEP